MGQGKEVKIKPDPKVEIQEKGEIFFFYRPRVNKDEVHSADDVQRLYIVLRPESGERPIELKQDSESGKEGKKISKVKKEENDDDETKRVEEVGGKKIPKVKEEENSEEETKKVEELKGGKKKITKVKEEENSDDETKKAEEVKGGKKIYKVKEEENSDEETKKAEEAKGGKRISKVKEEENSDRKTKKVKGKGELGSEGGHGSEEVNIEQQPLLRFIVMGRKSLPDPHKRSRPYWGFVEMVTTKVDDIKTALKGEEYDTATRGHRHRSPARALGEGVYRILRHQPSPNKIHTHLIYKLELPAPNKGNEPQESLHIEREASFIIQIKNPDTTRPSRSDNDFRGLQTKRKALFPASLQGSLGSKRFGPADPPDFLNYEGCEFLLIAASDDLEEELGLELEGEVDESRADESCSDLIQMFGEAGSAKPLLSGTWV